MYRLNFSHYYDELAWNFIIISSHREIEANFRYDIKGHYTASFNADVVFLKSGVLSTVSFW